jgi:hypothetical protein
MSVIFLMFAGVFTLNALILREVNGSSIDEAHVALASSIEQVGKLTAK